jgi:hypothetical protein
METFPTKEIKPIAIGRKREGNGNNHLKWL